MPAVLVLARPAIDVVESSGGVTVRKPGPALSKIRRRMVQGPCCRNHAGWALCVGWMYESKLLLSAEQAAKEKS